MSQVVTFYRKQPKGIVVNGEAIPEEAIANLMDQFADAPEPREAAARAIAVRTLLRQRAQVLQIEADDEEQAIERLLTREVTLPPVSDEEVQRYFEGHRQKFRSGDLFEARHILFSATGDEAEKKEVARRAEAALLHLKSNPEEFERIARQDSTCSSAKLGGALGQLSQGSVVPEFWAALVGFGKTGILPHVVETRYGFHIVAVDRCAMGEELPFEAVKMRIRDYLVGRLEQMTYQGYVAGLIESARISGVEFGDQSPKTPGPGLPMDFNDEGRGAMG